MLDLWFTEKQTKNVNFTCRIARTLHTETSKFQNIAVLETEEFGKMLVLDGTVQTTVEDEFIYHEMITHIPLYTHPNPKMVLVIGGGDGGTIREILKHPSVELVVLVEIDERVVEVSKMFLPEISSALNDKRVRVNINDGIEYVKNLESNNYDVIIVDSTDPVGPAEGLFTLDFYKHVFKSLTEDGILIAQTESPFFNRSLIKRVYKNISTIFPIAKLFLANIPTYPSGLWSFTIGSKKYDPVSTNLQDKYDIDCKYYTKELHRSCFVLPKFVQELLK
jgi:spermidine synthase